MMGISPVPSSSIRQLSMPKASRALSKCSAPLTTNSPFNSELRRTSSLANSKLAGTRASFASYAPGASISDATPLSLCPPLRAPFPSLPRRYSAPYERVQEAYLRVLLRYTPSCLARRFHSHQLFRSNLHKVPPLPPSRGRSRMSSTSPLRSPIPEYVKLFLTVC